jgi:hypothetical protein
MGAGRFRPFQTIGITGQSSVRRLLPGFRLHPIKPAPFSATETFAKPAKPSPRRFCPPGQGGERLRPRRGRAGASFSTAIESNRWPSPKTGRRAARRGRLAPPFPAWGRGGFPQRRQNGRPEPVSSHPVALASGRLGVGESKDERMPVGTGCPPGRKKSGKMAKSPMFRVILW